MRLYLKQKKKMNMQKIQGSSSVVRHLPNMDKTPGSIHRSTEKK